MTTRHRSMDPLLLLGSIIFFAAFLTWVLPAGRFSRVKDEVTGRTKVVAGSYVHVPRQPVGPWGAVLSIPEGLADAADIVFFVLLAGAAISVVESTGAVTRFLDLLMRRLGQRPLLVLAAASVLFLVGGAVDEMYEEILAFIPVLCLLMRRLRLEPVMALGVSVGTASVAAAFSPCNTFMLGISQPMAELPVFSGFAFRSVVFVVAIAIWAAYLGCYALTHRSGLASPLAPAPDDDLVAAQSSWTRRDGWVIAVMNTGMIIIVAGGIVLHWGLREFGGVFLMMGAISGWLGGLGWRGTANQFAEGFRNMALAAALIGFARAISVVLAHGMVLDTIANALFSPLRHLPVGLAAVAMFASESLLAFPMPSDSGRALVSLPVLLPVADLLGITRQMAVIAYQYASYIGSLMTPTAGAFLAMLLIAKVSFGRWLRFMAIPFCLLFLLSVAAMLAGVRLGIH